jgi:hypothetical protein
MIRRRTIKVEVQYWASLHDKGSTETYTGLGCEGVGLAIAHQHAIAGQDVALTIYDGDGTKEFWDCIGGTFRQLSVRRSIRRIAKDLLERAILA